MYYEQNDRNLRHLNLTHKMEDTPALDQSASIRALVERAINRNIKGAEYIASPAPLIGVTPRSLLKERGTMRVYHYPPLADEVYRVPILFVMATTNRGAIFDLSHGQSMFEFLLNQGYDIYLLEWEPPRAYEKNLTLTHYVTEFIPEAVKIACEHSGENEVTLAGYCFGGVLSLIYLSLHLDGPVKNLVTFATPTDFSKMELFAAWTNPEHFDVDYLVDTLGNVPSEMIFGSFDLLQPATRLASNVRLWDKMWDDEYVSSYRKMDRWLNDTLPLAGEYFRETTKKLLWSNGLISGQLEFAGRRADISKIEVPFLHVIAKHDSIVPFESSHPLIGRIGSQDKEEVVLKGGHVSLAAGANAIHRLWPKLDHWLQERST